MIALSFSRWKWTACPHAFNALYIEKSWKEPVTEIMEIGGEVAGILGQYRKHCYQQGINSDLGFLDDEVCKFERTRELLNWFKRTPYVTVPLDATSILIEKQMAFDKALDLIVPGPKQSDQDAWFSKQAAFRIIPDFSYRLNDTLFIIDDKTGYGDPDPLQIRIMAYLIYRAIPPLKAAGLTRVRGDFNCVAKQDDPLTVEFGVDELVPIRDMILDKISTVNAWTDFPAIANDQCGFCTVPDCPLRKEAETALVTAVSEQLPEFRIPTAITTQEEAETSLIFRLFLASIEKRIDALQRTWVQDHGPIEAGGKVLGFDPVESWKPKDFQQFAAVLMSYGITKEQILANVSYTKTGIEKTLKKAKRLDKLPLVMRFLDVKTWNKFDMKSAKADDNQF